MAGGEGGETIKPITKEANAETAPVKTFEENLKTVKSILDTKDDATNGKKLDDAHEISDLLDKNFEDGLKNLTTGKEEEKNMYDATKNILDNDFKNRPDTDPDKMAIKALNTFLHPMILNASEGITINATDTKIGSYNAKEKGGKSFIENTQKDLKDAKYNSLPGIKTIQDALDTSSIANIQTLQTFLLNKITDPAKKLAFYQSSWKGQKTADTVPSPIIAPADGGFGPGTQTALKGYLDDFSATYNEKVKNKDNIAKNIDLKIEGEKKIDEQSSKNLEKSNVTYTNPEQANKTVTIDGGQVKYRGETNTIDTLMNKTVSVAGMSIPPSFITPTDPNDLNQTALKNRTDAVDKKLDVNIVTYNEKSNTYQYKGKEISRDNVGNEKGKMTLENFQNEVDKMLMSDKNDTRNVQTEVSADGKTSKKIIDFAGDRGYKIKTDIKSDAGSTNIKDVKRGENLKTVTTETDKEGNVINKTKIQQNKESYKQAGKNTDINLKKTPESGKTFVSASSEDVYSAINKSDKTTIVTPIPDVDPENPLNLSTSTEVENNQLLANYEMKADGQGRITINLKKDSKGLEKSQFEKVLGDLLKKGGIADLDMKDYTLKGKKGEKGEVIVNKLVFNVGENTKIEEAPIRMQPRNVTQIPVTNEQPTLIKDIPMTPIDNTDKNVDYTDSPIKTIKNDNADNNATGVV